MKRGVPMLAFAMIAAAFPIHAQTVVAAPFFEPQLGPGDMAFFSADCDSGDLVSGGYVVDSRPESHSYAIERTYPETATRWTIQIRNISDRPIEIGGRVYGVCLER